MQTVTLGLSMLNDDPFVVVKNFRRNLIRPKAKYVRKVPYIRKLNKKAIKKNPEKAGSKNERKMTADSDL